MSGMSVTADTITSLLNSSIPNISFLDLKDTSNGCGQCYELVIVSSEFEGKPLLARHKLVNTALASVLPQIHAFSQKTLTPEQWEKQKQ